MSFKAPMNTNSRIGQTVECRGGMVCIGGGDCGSDEMNQLQRGLLILRSFSPPFSFYSTPKAELKEGP